LGSCNNVSAEHVVVGPKMLAVAEDVEDAHLSVLSTFSVFV
jgi:hypothetical protein